MSWLTESLKAMGIPDQSLGSIYSAMQDPSQWGKRADGTTKGNGFFGQLPVSDGSTASEIGTGYELNGQETEVPAINPFQSQEQIIRMLNNPDASMDDDIARNTIDWGMKRKMMGKSPYIGSNEREYDLSTHDPMKFRLNPSLVFGLPKVGI